MLVDKLAELKYELAETFVQREAEITAVLSGLLSGEPVILVGEVGTAKTALIERLAKMIDARYFYYLLTRFTEPDELLGTLDINALREGKYIRRTEGKLPEAEIVFLDEIFKASSAIRNILLDIILNKRIFSDGVYIQLPMLALYTASNEISTDIEDMAFYDRLTIRCFVKSVSEDSWEELIEKGVLLDGGLEAPVLLSVEDIKEFQRIVNERFKNITQNTTLIRKYIEALAVLRQRGVKISDRRKIKVLKTASAISVVYGEENVSLDSLAEALKFAAVHDEDEVHVGDEYLLHHRLGGIPARHRVAPIQDPADHGPQLGIIHYHHPVAGRRRQHVLGALRVRDDPDPTFGGNDVALAAVDAHDAAQSAIGRHRSAAPPVPVQVDAHHPDARSSGHGYPPAPRRRGLQPSRRVSRGSSLAALVDG